MSDTLSFEVKISDQFKDDLWNEVADYLAAGVCNYWAQPSFAAPVEDKSIVVAEVDERSGRTLDWRRLNPSVILQAFLAIARSDHKYVAPSYRMAVIRSLFSDDLDIDAEIADIIVQIAVMGEVRYG